MEGPLSRVLCGALAATALLTATASARPADDFVEGEAIVTYRESATLAVADASAGRHAAKLTRHFGWLSARRKRVMGVVKSDRKSTAALIADLQKDPDVLVAEPNYLRRVSAFRTPDDPSFSKLWALANTGQSVNGTSGAGGADIGFTAAWNLARPLSGEVVVAVMDTGLDTTHPDIVGSLWTNPGEIPNNGLDDDGDGRIDDVHGFNFVGGNGNVADSGEHGTHVAGTIAASGNNGMGVVGAGLGMQVMALKVSGDGKSISTAAEIAALEYVGMMKARGVNIVAINASFGGGSFSSAESAAISAAGNAGIVFCAAAGNEGANNDTTATYPANYRLPNMIVVAASTQSDTLASFSNRGATTVDIAAPGTNIYSLRPTWMTAATPSLTAGGTSLTAGTITYAGISAGVTATLVNCGNGNSASQFPAAVAGNVALIQRGTETFATKLNHAMRAGAAAAVIYNNVPGSFNGTLATPGAFIPAVTVSQADGATLLDLVGTPVNVANTVADSAIYQYLDGTSMATPHVAAAVGFAALNFPTESAVQRVARIVNHTTPVPALSGFVKTGGRLDLLKIVETDSDGLPDWWESDRFATLANNGTEDPDSDGSANSQEFLAGTNPTDPASVFAIANAGLNPEGHFSLAFESVVGVTYRVEINDTLDPAGWHPLGTDHPGNGGLVETVDSSPDRPTQRFYRVRIDP